jgi:hypothetical protein
LGDRESELVSRCLIGSEKRESELLLLSEKRVWVMESSSRESPRVYKGEKELERMNRGEIRTKKLKLYPLESWSVEEKK